MNNNTSRIFFISMLFFSFSVHSDGLKLNSGATSLTGNDTVQFKNLKLNDQFYDAEIKINVDGTYSLISLDQPATESTSRYTVTFNSIWSSTSHPYLYPMGSSHFSRLIGLTHNATTSIWRTNMIASEGIEDMAETGGTSILSREIQALIDNEQADQLLLGSGIGSSPGSTEFTFDIHQSYPYVSLVSMIAPSPDWFIGVSAINMIQNGEWVDEITIPLFAYDAGTDSGTNYISGNDDTNPAQPISRLNELPFTVDEEARPLGSFTFKKVE